MPGAASNQNPSIAPNNNPFAIVKLKKMAWYILPVVKKTKNYFCEHNLLPVMQKLLLTCLLICVVAQST